MEADIHVPHTRARLEKRGGGMGGDEDLSPLQRQPERNSSMEEKQHGTPVKGQSSWRNRGELLAMRVHNC